MLSSTVITVLTTLIPISLAAPLEDNNNGVYKIATTYESNDGCLKAETPALYCYTKANHETPQNITVSDIQALADGLRGYGQETSPGRLLTMTPQDSANCGEWTLGYPQTTAIATAKHINSTISSSVAFEDIANTIDGGPGASPAHTAGIISCLQDGGRLGVQVNQSNEAYYTSDYAAGGYSWDGILIKVVHPASS
ncbi:hypothetical protein N431DRAFT_558449 [Stipitochalara longipes BDJ]|nr:hypothetical protein N431DRAFT_558449 [Stipitochalara longipes BDJ]